ncbi:MAG: 2-amino-4-hydroxy-6-hydroxymethyldihydropteridine diphosphokinase [Verrucomicrobia bacterium]|nr:MAG: 2-amino-4-hydroxy-6-hydroxymethyldihydropteridine diphosphokinase [Verrucomicrobiota bacterium]
MITEAGLSLGSNLGDRLANLRAARQCISALPGVRLVTSAPIYETEPVGVKPEYRHLAFLNTVLIVTGDFPPAAWRRLTAQIEDDLGRVRSDDKFAPRTLDIDVLYVGDLCCDDGGVIIPHPRWAGRRFVLQPLADVRPDLVLPGAKQTVFQTLESLPPDEVVTLFSTAW